jgi:PII-like signaling protein
MFAPGVLRAAGAGLLRGGPERRAMPDLQPGTLLRVYIREGQRHEGLPLQDAILALLHEAGISGASVIRGVAGYGADGQMHATGWLSFGAGLPLLIEAVDREEKLVAVVPRLEAILAGGIVTMSAVEFRHYPADRPAAP